MVHQNQNLSWNCKKNKNNQKVRQERQKKKKKKKKKNLPFEVACKSNVWTSKICLCECDA